MNNGLAHRVGLSGWMHGWMDGSMDGWMNGWICQCMDRYIWMDKTDRWSKEKWIDDQMHGCSYGSGGGLVDDCRMEWMDSWMG